MRKIELEITKRCNFQCIFCLAEAGEGRSGEFSVSELIPVLDEAKQIGFKEIIVTGGEPLLREDLFEILKEIKKFCFRIILNTNSWLLNRNTITEFKRLKVDLVRMSLYGHKSEVHERITGVPGSFNCLIKAVKTLKKESIPVAMAIVMFRQNLNYLEDIVKFAAELGVKVSFSRIIMGGRAKNHSELALTPADYKSYIQTILWLREKYENIGMGYLKNTETFAFLVDSKLAYKTCEAGVGNIGIRSDLKVTPCLALVPFIIGDLRKQKLSEILSSEKIKFFKDFSSEKADKNCRICAHFSNCRSGCRAHAFYRGGISARDPGCFID